VKLISLVWVNLKRNKRRSILTLLSVTVAMLLFCSLGGVIDTLDESIRVGSETRLVTINSISMVFDLPISYRARVEAVPGVEKVTVMNWFGGQDPKDTKNFFAQFGVDAETYFSVYKNDLEIVDASPAQAAVAMPPDLDPKLAAFMSEQTGCVVGEKLMKKMGWKLGQTYTLSGTIYPGDWPFTIRAVYRPKIKAFNDEMMLFHWKYLYEHSGHQNHLGILVLQLAHPDQAAAISKEVDAMFDNSSSMTRTETERAFQASFVSMLGNVPLVLRVVGLAVVFAILMVAANTMVMAVRERTGEIGVLKTLGFEDGTIFRLVLAEGAIITLGGGLLGALASKALIEWTGFNAGGALPPMIIRWSTVAIGAGVSLFLGAVSGFVPAWQASRLRIVETLRRVE
jgi:putative ABC transport system permease protein